MWAEPVVIFRPTPVAGAVLLELERREDERGFFARSWCAREFEAQGLDPRLVQCNVSWNRHRGTVRGLHWQEPPHAEAKLVRCTRGAIWDVVVDVRPGSPSYKRHFAVELDDDNRLALYVPPGCAHGFQTLREGSEIFYQMSEFYAPEHQRGARWNDPAFAIPWPLPEVVIHPRDAAYPDFEP